MHLWMMERQERSIWKKESQKVPREGKRIKPFFPLLQFPSTSTYRATPSTLLPFPTWLRSHSAAQLSELKWGWCCPTSEETWMISIGLLFWPLDSQLFALLRSIRKDSRQNKAKNPSRSILAAQVISLKSSLLFPALSSALTTEVSPSLHITHLQHTQFLTSTHPGWLMALRALKTPSTEFHNH